MTLQHWLAATGTRRVDFAARVGVSERTIGHLSTGDVRPSSALAMRIEQATAGAVTAADWPPRHNGKLALREGPRG